MVVVVYPGLAVSVVGGKDQNVYSIAYSTHSLWFVYILKLFAGCRNSHDILMIFIFHYQSTKVENTSGKYETCEARNFCSLVV